MTIIVPDAPVVPMVHLELRDPQTGRLVILEVPADYSQAECEALAGFITGQLHEALVAGSHPPALLLPT